MTTKTITSTTSTGAHNFTFGVFDKFENKLRMGFVSHDIKQLAIATADRIVAISLAGGEDTYKPYQNKIIGFQDALEIFETHGFILANFTIETKQKQLQDIMMRQILIKLREGFLIFLI